MVSLSDAIRHYAWLQFVQKTNNSIYLIVFNVFYLLMFFGKVFALPIPYQLIMHKRRNQNINQVWKDKYKQT